VREHLGFYTVDELTEIVRRNARKLQVPVEEDAAVEISRRARSTPRVANRLLRWIRDFADSKSDGRVSLAVARAALEMLGVDQLGLDSQDRAYLRTLIRVFSGGPTGIEAIAHTMNVSNDTLVDEVEPFLLRTELLVRTPRGRMATAKAFNHLRITREPDDDDDPEQTLFD